MMRGPTPSESIEFVDLREVSAGQLPVRTLIPEMGRSHGSWCRAEEVAPGAVLDGLLA
jgi:hypothetical protein